MHIHIYIYITYAVPHPHHTTGGRGVGTLDHIYIYYLSLSLDSSYFYVIHLVLTGLSLNCFNEFSCAAHFRPAWQVMELSSLMWQEFKAEFSAGMRWKDAGGRKTSA